MKKKNEIRRSFAYERERERILFSPGEQSGARLYLYFEEPLKLRNIRILIQASFPLLISSLNYVPSKRLHPSFLVLMLTLACISSYKRPLHCCMIKSYF